MAEKRYKYLRRELTDAWQWRTRGAQLPCPSWISAYYCWSPGINFFCPYRLKYFRGHGRDCLSNDTGPDIMPVTTSENSCKFHCRLLPSWSLVRSYSIWRNFLLFSFLLPFSPVDCHISTRILTSATKGFSKSFYEIKPEGKLPRTLVLGDAIVLPLFFRWPLWLKKNSLLIGFERSPSIRTRPSRIVKCRCFSILIKHLLIVQLYTAWNKHI